MVPDGWTLGNLGDLAETQMGFAFKSTDFVEQGVPLIRMGNLYQNNFDLSRNPVFLPDTFLDEYERFILKSGDLIMSLTGTIGKQDYGFTIQIPNESPSCLLNQRVMKLIPKDATDKAFLLHLLKSQVVLSKLYSFPGGTKQANLSAAQVKGIRIGIPPLPEQKKIARILSTWDKAIETVDKLIENSKQQKKALMQQLLTGKKRLPGFSGEWKEVRLGKVATINPKKSAKPEDGLVSFLPMEAISETAQLLSLETKRYEEVSKGFSAFSDGDVLVAKITPCFENGKGAYVTNLTNGIGFGSTEFHVIRTEQELSSRFIYYITNSYEFRFRGEANMQGSAGQRRVPTDFLRAYPIALPPIDEQKAICSILDAVSLTIDKLSNKKELFTHAKQALMQQLLTGKRRVEA